MLPLLLKVVDDLQVARIAFRVRWQKNVFVYSSNKKVIASLITPRTKHVEQDFRIQEDERVQGSTRNTSCYNTPRDSLFKPKKYEMKCTHRPSSTRDYTNSTCNQVHPTQSTQDTDRDNGNDELRKTTFAPVANTVDLCTNASEFVMTHHGRTCWNCSYNLSGRN